MLGFSCEAGARVMRYNRGAFWCFGFSLLILLIFCLSTQIRHTKPNQQYYTTESETGSLTIWPVSSDIPADTPRITDYDSPNLLSNTIPLIKSKGTTRTPNIIFAMADDLGWGDVQYNHGNARTPNLNKMAYSPNTILLQRHYSGSPVCSPTRGTVLTGRNHNRYCIWDANVGRGTGDFVRPEKMALPLSEVTIGKVMQEAGYSTALFGKWHIGDFKPLNGGNKKWPVSHPGLHGFDQWLATERSAPSCSVNCACFDNSECVLGHYHSRPPCTNYYTNKSDNIEGWPEVIPGDDSHFIWSLAESYIKEQVNANKPFFLYLPFHSVHVPYVATQQYRDMYLKQQFSSMQADYYGAISALDNVIGQLRKLIEELGIRNNTLFWFTSDNGPEANTPGVTNGLRGRKRSLNEGGIRVPGMIEWPNVIKNNKVSTFPVVTSDLLPTVCDILGIKPTDNRSIDGISILPFLQGKVEKRNQLIHWAFSIQGNFKGLYKTATSGDRYKLIATYKNGKAVQYQLYDLVNDHGEIKDLSKSNPVVSSEMLSQVEEWRKSVINSAKVVGCLGT